MKNMDIAIDASRAIRSRKTGVEWYACKLIEALAKIAPPGWRVDLIVDNSPPPSLRVRGGREGLVPSFNFSLPPQWSITSLRWPPRYLWSQVRLAAHLQITRPNLFFSPVHVLPFLATAPAVVTIHDVDYVTHPEAYSAKGRAYLKLTTRFAVRRAVRVLVPSEATRQGLIKYFGASPEKIAVTPLAPIITDIPPASEVAAVKKKLGIEWPYFLFLGRLETKKNAVRVIEAFKKIQPALGETRLLLVGRPGRGYEAVRSAIKNAGLGDRIFELGWRSAEEVTTLLTGATALVFPSLAEGFGLPILDAFAVGTPVITSASIATEEVAGGAAVLVDPFSTDEIADAMKSLAENHAPAVELAAKGREWVKNFSWEKTARQTLAVFQEII
ncbi:glycosyltransferase family 1 protein [Patescibacteria group bacterium]|nr:MAG: glycosyltransferase family 1 protein [Patescibacteria group bacterium]